MCGICGVVARRPPFDLSVVARMSESLAHRGPDSGNVYVDDGVALAVRRLAVIDVAGGTQPLFNEDRSLVLVANGEIYNYRELRARLRARGHAFRTESDCEVIVHLFEERGPDAVEDLRGMFAFALWDVRRRRLLLARDRMGEKPLYLLETKDALVFASELRALVGSGLVPFELDPAAVDLFFHYQYVPEPATPVPGIRKQRRATTLALDADAWRTSERRYWEVTGAEPLRHDPATRLRRELDELFPLVVHADVSVGVALSGGLDSAIVAALGARASGGELRAFAVGYTGAPWHDERADARALARFLDLPFAEIELSPDDVVDALPSVVDEADDPIADMAGFGYRAVMRLAGDHGVRVMMLGQGGDELFWGYEWLRTAATRSREALAGGAGRVTAPCELIPSFAAARAELPSLYTEDFAARLREDPVSPFLPGDLSADSVDVAWTAAIADTYLLENGIAQGDRHSMAASVELRLPLVDHRLVEAVIGLRKQASDLDLPPKSRLRESVRDLLPADVLERPKRPFLTPIGEWQRVLFAHYGDLLRDGYLAEAGIFSRPALAALASGPMGKRIATPVSYKALVLELWCRSLASRAREARRQAAPAAYAVSSP
jgi:asparagine synthase (glutamine-hydrolysing)